MSAGHAALLTKKAAHNISSSIAAERIFWSDFGTLEAVLKVLSIQFGKVTKLVRHEMFLLGRKIVEMPYNRALSFFVRVSSCKDKTFNGYAASFVPFI